MMFWELAMFCPTIGRTNPISSRAYQAVLYWGNVWSLWQACCRVGRCPVALFLHRLMQDGSLPTEKRFAAMLALIGSEIRKPACSSHKIEMESLSACRKLRQRQRKEARFAKYTRRGIALEDLTGIRDRVTVRKRQRRSLYSWSFHDLRQKITYKVGVKGWSVYPYLLHKESLLQTNINAL